MISESLRPAGQEALESRVEFLPGATYSAPEGLPGFPEAKEFTVHHVEDVAGQKIVWFSGSKHSLDYSILAPHEYAKLPADTPTKTGPTPDRTAFAELLTTNPKTVKIDISKFTDQDQQDIRTLIDGLKKQKLLTVSTTLYEGGHLAEGQTLAVFGSQQEADPSEGKPEKLNHNDSELLQFTLGLLESAQDPATAASLGKLLRILVARQKKYERRIEVVPTELQPLHRNVSIPYLTTAVKAWAESFVRSGYHYLGRSLADDIEYTKQCTEESPAQIITPETLLPQPKHPGSAEIVHTHPGVRNRNNKNQFDLEVKQLLSNLRLQQHQADVGAFESSTFKDPQLEQIFFNHPESNQKSRTLQDTEAFGSLVVGFIGVDNNPQSGQPSASYKKNPEANLLRRLKRTKKPNTVTQQPKNPAPAPIRYNKGLGRELIGIGGAETEIVFYFSAPGRNGQENYKEAVPFALEILCPATKTAEEVQEFLLSHPDPETADFFQKLNENGGMQCTGSHYLRIQVTSTLDRSQAANYMTQLSQEAIKTQTQHLNPANMLMMLGALDPESASEPDIYKEWIQSSTFRQGSRRTPAQS